MLASTLQKCVMGALTGVLVLGATAVQPEATPAAPVMHKPVTHNPVTHRASAPLNADFAAADALAEKWVKEIKLPGAALLVMYDGKVIQEKFFGEYTASTVIPIASASKWLAGAVIMSLVDDKVLDLDKPIGDVLTSLPEDKRPITLGQLFSHTSGLPSDIAGAASWTASVDAVIKAVGESKVENEPGAAFKYGGASMQLAAVMACKVTGKTWHELFEQRIAKPCAMKYTQVGRLGAMPNPQVTGGASSTLGDYANFLTMLSNNGVFNGTRVLSEAAVAEMLKDRTKDAKKARASLMRMLDGSGYGVGNWVDRKNAKGESIANSSPGAFGFVPWIDQERKVVGIWMICDRERQRRKAGAKLESPRDAVTKAVEAAIAKQNAATKP